MTCAAAAVGQRSRSLDWAVVGDKSPSARKPTMEDCFLIDVDVEDAEQDWLLFGVFDGHAGKEVAKELSLQLGLFVKNEILLRRQRLVRGRDSDTTVGEEAVLLQPNEFGRDPEDEDLSTWMPALLDYAFREFDSRFRASSSGSTATLVFVTPRFVISANVGDSEAILCQPPTVHATALSLDGGDRLGFQLLTYLHQPTDPEEAHRVISLGGRMLNGRVLHPLSTKTRPFGLNVSRGFGDFSYTGHPQPAQQSSGDGSLSEDESCHSKETLHRLWSPSHLPGSTNITASPSKNSNTPSPPPVYRILSRNSPWSTALLSHPLSLVVPLQKKDLSSPDSPVGNSGGVPRRSPLSPAVVAAAASSPHSAESLSKVISAKPYVSCHRTLGPFFFVLATDGLWGQHRSTFPKWQVHQTVTEHLTAAARCTRHLSATPPAPVDAANLPRGDDSWCWKQTLTDCCHRLVRIAREEKHSTDDITVMIVGVDLDGWFLVPSKSAAIAPPAAIGSAPNETCLASDEEQDVPIDDLIIHLQYSDSSSDEDEQEEDKLSLPLDYPISTSPISCLSDDNRLYSNFQKACTLLCSNRDTCNKTE